MNQYYYIDQNGNQAGPVSVEELRNLRLIPDTLVWCAGMAEWAKISTIAELQVQTQTPPMPPQPQPPTPPQQPQYQQSQQPAVQPVNNEVKPDNYMVWAILSTLLCCLPFGIVAIVYASKVDGLWAQGNKADAIKNANNAKTWSFVSLGGGILAFVIYFFIGILSSL